VEISNRDSKHVSDFRLRLYRLLADDQPGNLGAQCGINCRLLVDVGNRGSAHLFDVVNQLLGGPLLPGAGRVQERTFLTGVGDCG